MTTTEILTEVAIVITLGSLMGKLSWKLGSVSSKVDTMWEFLMRRAMSQAIIDRHGSINSPFMVTPDAKRLFDSLAEDLRNFHAPHRSLGDMDLALAIERQFGKQILEIVCIPNKMTQGECLLVAVAVAREAKLDTCTDCP